MIGRLDMRLWTAFLLLHWSVGDAHGALALKGRLEWLHLEGLHKVEMRVVENGVVEEVAVTAGQRVSRGHLLVRMDQRSVNANLLAAKAQGWAGAL